MAQKDPQASTWIEQQIAVMLDRDLPEEWDLDLVMTYARWAYGEGYVAGLHELGVTPLG